jgi:hypothetical protein
VFGDIRSWNDNLSERDGVVGKENDLKVFSSLLVHVDYVCDGIDKLDESLGEEVSRCGFSSEDRETRDDSGTFFGRKLSK